jgi:ABC-type Fe3+ transport system substrate-binding protein
VINKPPHPNAAKVFLNWLLGGDGQEIFSRAMRVATWRLHVNTRGTKGFGALPLKVVCLLSSIVGSRSNRKKKFYSLREPGSNAARKLLGS